MSEYYWEKGDDDVESPKDDDDHEDSVRDFVIDSEEEFDEASEEKEDCRVQRDGGVFDYPAYMEILNAIEKERTNSDATYWRI